jgi:hypothetical protein
MPNKQTPGGFTKCQQLLLRVMTKHKVFNYIKVD